MNYAYDELYLRCSQRMMGDMYDYAVNTLNIELNEFQQMFLVSNISKQISIGNPMYIAGMNGCEVAKRVVEDCKGYYPDDEDVMYLDKSPEYWLGWALAYYQWHSNVEFKAIERVCSATCICGMYNPLHEADISKFVEIMDERMLEYNKISALKRIRKYADLSQSMLAKEADVPLRQIQLFEQGQRDIRKCQAGTVARLARTLHCRTEDLL